MVDTTNQAKLEAYNAVALSTPATDTQIPPDLYKTVEYPTYLGSDEYPHFMMFFINENTKTKFSTNTSAAQQQALDANKAVRDDRLGQMSSSAVLKGVAAAGIDIAGQAGAAITNAGATVLAAAGVDSMKDKKVTNTDLKITEQLKKRSSVAISLPIPNNLNQAFSAQYAEINMGAMGSGIMDIASRVIDGKDEAAGDTVKSAMGTMGVSAARSLAKKSAGFMGTSEDSMVAMVDKSIGMVQNQRQEMAFRQMSMRRFHFTWELVPRTKQEHDNILKIIKLFKSHMLPELPETGASNLLMPSEFDIQFRYKTYENESIGRIGTCALEDIAVNYTAAGKFVAASGTDKPMVIELTLAFIEVEPLLRDMVEKRGF